jgi:hypothetical protein
LLRRRHGLQVGEHALDGRVVTGIGQSADIRLGQLGQRFDIAGQQVVTLVAACLRSAVGPRIDPPDGLILVVGEVAKHANIIPHRQIHDVIAVLCLDAIAQVPHRYIMKPYKCFPQIGGAFRVGIAVVIAAASDLGQPAFGLVGRQ